MLTMYYLITIFLFCDFRLGQAGSRDLRYHNHWKSVCQGSKYPSAVADPGLPQRGGVNPRGWREHTILPNCPKKLHENKRIWTPWQGVRPRTLLSKYMREMQN